MENTIKYKRYREYPYKFKSNGNVYTYEELKEYFFIDGSECIYCTKDFGKCKSGKYYLVILDSDNRNVYIVDDISPFDSCYGKEYMKEYKKVYLEFTPQEISILSNGLQCLIKNAYESKSKIYDRAANKELDKAAREYQRINEKICGAVPGME